MRTDRHPRDIQETFDSTHARALLYERLSVHGWYYDILSGRIERYDEAEHRFLPLLP